MRRAVHADVLKRAVLRIDPKKEVYLMSCCEHLLLQLSAQHEDLLTVACREPANCGVQISPLNVWRVIHKDKKVRLAMVRIDCGELVPGLSYQPAQLDVKRKSYAPLRIPSGDLVPRRTLMVAGAQSPDLERRPAAVEFGELGLFFVECSAIHEFRLRRRRRFLERRWSCGSSLPRRDIVSLGKLPGRLARKWGHPQACSASPA
jgi:hypothetical protein